MDDALRQAKLAKLIEIEGYDSIEELIEVVFSDAVSPAICMNLSRPCGKATTADTAALADSRAHQKSGTRYR